ncbi:MAG: penicillin acylase family protein, partial [Saprospiraceae bacterium]
FPDTTFSIYRKPKISNDSLLSDSTKRISFNNIEQNFDITSELGKDYFDINQSYRKFLGINCSHVGSNSWVVSGDKSESGKPLLANDPHLSFQAPSKWYEIHLKSNSIDVTGMSIPGVPCIVIGHNKNIAWGMTNLMNDDNDFVILDKDSSDLSKYRYKNQSFSMDSTLEKINVKDSTEVFSYVQNTRIGPVISNLRKRSFADVKKENIGEKFNGDKILTFKWTGYEYSDEIMCFYKLNAANNWDDFKNGLKDFNAPAMNFTYADVTGNIGYHAGGKIPIRKTSNENNIIIPSTDELEWTGFVDFDKLPNEYNPKDGYIITANTNPFEWLKTESKDKYYISYVWEPSSRFNRIKELLRDRSKFSLSDFRLIQMDYQSPYAREVAKHLISAFKNYSNEDQNVSRALELLKDWNGEIRSNEAQGSIYNCFLVALINNIFQDELGDNIFRDYLVIQNLSYRAIDLLLKTENSEWFDNINTSSKETKEQIIQKSLFDAIEVLKQEFPHKEIYNWQWGELHQVKFKHPLGMIPALDKTFNIGPFEVGGDQTTINNSEFSFNAALEEVNFGNNLGPSMRFLIDMADVSRALTVNTTGQSGQPLHPNYKDQSRMWQFGDYKQGVFEEYQITGSNLKVLTLTPSN